MSLNQYPLEKVKVIDPRLEYNNPRLYAVLKGSMVNSWVEYIATNKSSSNVQITINPPSPDTAVSRYVLQHYKFTSTITGTNTSGGPLLQPNCFAPRAWPLAGGVLLSSSVTLNSGTVTQSPINTYWNALLRYHSKHDSRYTVDSIVPSMLDQFNTYSDGLNTNRNPLSSGFGDNAYDVSRGCYFGMNVTSNPNGGTTAVVELDVYEPIVMSPFVFHKEANYTPSLIGLSNMSYLATFGNLNRVMSLIQNQGQPGLINITGISTVLDGASILLNFFTPDPVMKIPSQLSCNYFSIVSYPTAQNNSWLPGETKTAQMSSVTLSSIPRRLYIFARKDDNILTPFDSDSFFAIPKSGNPLILTWGTNQFFGGASPIDLYNICCKNASTDSAKQFFDLTGSIICLDCGTDIGEMSDMAPGVTTNLQIALSINLKNLSTTETITPTLYVVAVYEGVFNLDRHNGVTLDVGVLTSKDVLSASQSSGVNIHNIEPIYGGDLFSKLKSVLPAANRFLRDTHVVSNALSSFPGTSSVGNVARSLGYGVTAGGYDREKGGVLLGGRRLHRSQM